MMRFTVEPSGSGIVLSDAVLETMDRFRQVRQNDREAGGQLFARFDGTETIIVEASVPKWLDHRSRYGFRPNRWLQQREIRAMHAKGLHFVGDWHTHPEPIPNASAIDLASMREEVSLSKHDLKAFILIIVGTQPAPDGLYVDLIQPNTRMQLHLSQD